MEKVKKFLISDFSNIESAICDFYGITTIGIIGGELKRPGNYALL